MTSPVRILVLDVLKPHKPNILELGKVICADKSVDGVNISVYAVDEKTESLKMILEGGDIDFEKVRGLLENNGAVIHSMDKVVLGKRNILEAPKISDLLTKY
jgi:hypothetical protein